MAFRTQTWTLTKKNLRIALSRHWASTFLRAFLLPVVFMFFISYIKNFFVPPSQFGVGTSTQVRGFIEALEASTGGRDTVAFVNSGHTGGDIENLINYLSVSIRTAGKAVAVLDSDEALLTTCRSSLRGVSTCYGAASFHSSPNEGPGGIWNYTLRADGALNQKLYVDRHDNDAEIYVLPFQRAIDTAIANQFNGSTNGTFPTVVNELPFTDKTQEQRAQDIRRLYMSAVINFLGVAYFIGICGILYQLTGHMASERELGMSQLIEAMTPSRHTQWARLLANHLAFDLIYLPGWIIMGIIIRALVFTKTSYGITIGVHILSGLALSSLAILGGSLFRKAQLSGITVIIISLVLAIVVQVVGPKSSGAVAILNLLFAPMNYTIQIIQMAYFEKPGKPTNLASKAPGSPWQLPMIAFWVFSIIQILIYPIIGAFIERSLYSTASKARKINFDSSESSPAIKLSSFSKHYKPSWWSKRISPLFGGEKRETVFAVNELSLEVLRGQIMVLLGANGSGKSTTLDAIAGIGSVTSGEIEVDATGGLGLCPQKNVLWDELTVYEHVLIFNALKSTGKRGSKEDIIALIRACDLEQKMLAKAKTLSGGQKRKLQLAMMFTGGSRVCCVDEVSSGLDPLSRRRIWDILLRERGFRTLLFTTHFLDEADVLSDHIAIMSKGSLKVEGSAVELKHKLGGGYRVLINHLPTGESLRVTDKKQEVISEISSVDANETSKRLSGKVFYELVDSAEAAGFVNEVERQGISDYQVSGPTIEDVFFSIEKVQQEPPSDRLNAEIRHSTRTKNSDKDSASDGISELKAGINELRLLSGSGTSIPRQSWILFCKRLIVLRRSYVPYIFAVIIPIIAAGLVTFFLKDFEALSCSPADQVSNPTVRGVSFQRNLNIPIGPRDRVSLDSLALLTGGNRSAFHIVDTYDDFNNYIQQRYQNITPGGIFLGDTPTFGYTANYVLYWSVLTQNILDNVLGLPITTQYQEFAVPFAPSAGKTLQLIFYFGLSMCAYPGFFTLYPTVERLRKVRALHYSNGVRAAPLWIAYTIFDFVFVLLVSVIVIIIWVAISDVWYYPSYLFVVFFLYGLTSVLLSYVVSLFVSSQLAAFAWAVGVQAVLFLLYFISYLSILTYSPAYNIDRDIRIAHFTIALITPAGNLLRGLLLTLNEFSILCQGDQKASYPGDITIYGGPILYLIVQAALLFIFLVCWDSGYKPAFLRRSATKKRDTENHSNTQNPDIMAEIERTESTSTGLQVQHLYKSFAGIPAVEDVTFNIPRSTCFALLGPNGAGKSTTISLIRGDLHSDHHGGDILVESISVSKHRAEARRNLGVCPQFDAMDSMTVDEHLRFYAKARGVPDINHNVDIIATAVGLEPYRDRLAQNLSGGNKRKLSLAIALMGNPAVLLLDEPSSGMDAVSKRVMWRTLEAVTKGRGILITTHSMEEADKLADRAGIMATRMLALGTSDELRKRFGDRYYVQLLLKGAPHVPEAQAHTVKDWVEQQIQGVEIEERMLYGQLRFSVPASEKSVANLFALLEDNKETLGLEYYSISQATLDQVFLEVVQRHNVEEEGEGKKEFGQRKGFHAWMRRALDDA